MMSLCRQLHVVDGFMIKQHASSRISGDRVDDIRFADSNAAVGNSCDHLQFIRHLALVSRYIEQVL